MTVIGRFFRPNGHYLSGGSVFLLMLPFLLLILFVFLYPILSLLSLSVLEPQPTLQHYERALTDPTFVVVMLRTVEIALTVTLLALAMSFPVAYLMVKSSGPKSLLITACIILPLWSSVLARTTAWAIMLQRNGLINDTLVALNIVDEPLKLLFTRTAVVLAMTHVLLPFMVLPIYGSLRSIPRDFNRAAEILGAGPLRRMREITLPLAVPGILAGCFMVFLTSLGYFITPALLGSPQEFMVSTLISQQMTMLLDWPFGGALVGVLTIFVLIITVVFGKVARFDRLMGAGA